MHIAECKLKKQAAVQIAHAVGCIFGFSSGGVHRSVPLLPSRHRRRAARVRPRPRPALPHSLDRGVGAPETPRALVTVAFPSRLVHSGHNGWLPRLDPPCGLLARPLPADRSRGLATRRCHPNKAEWFERNREWKRRFPILQHFVRLRNKGCEVASIKRGITG